MYATALKFIFSLIFKKPKPLVYFVKRHFGWSFRKLPILQATWSLYRQACLAAAIQQYAVRHGASMRVLGCSAKYERDVTLTDIIHPDREDSHCEGPPVQKDITLESGKDYSFTASALYLLTVNRRPLAIWVPEEDDDEIKIDVMSSDRNFSRQVIAELRELANEYSIYRGKVITSAGHYKREAKTVFHTTRKVSRENLILPEDVLEQIDRHTLHFSLHKDELTNRKMHLKRGFLVYGPPGCGKTSTMMYIVSNMPERTTIYMGAQNLDLLDPVCEFARSMQPSTVIVDDADLFASRHNRGSNSTALASLLNQMDGIDDDADILFLLSTNHPEELEAALGARPGRIDQAICIPLPDEDCRRRLIDLYGTPAGYDFKGVDKLIADLNGASGAFIKELFRKSVLLAMEKGKNSNVDDAVVRRAIKLLTGGSPMMAKLLAFEKPKEEQGELV